MLIEQNTPNTWQDLQQMVAQILKEAGFSVEVEKMIFLVRGQVIIDVFVQDPNREVASTFLVECKHWKTAVPQTVVHSFRTVVDDCGANAGLLISSAGFQSGAKEAAQNSNIMLLTWNQFQDRFAERWYKNHVVPILRDELGPLMEYTEPINSRIFKKADALTEKMRNRFFDLRKKHQDLAMTFIIAYFPLPGVQKSICPELPLVNRFQDIREENRPNLPEDLLQAKALRQCLDILVYYSRAALKEFDKVFGERA